LFSSWAFSSTVKRRLPSFWVQEKLIEPTDTWKENGEKIVLILINECQNLFNNY
jgi:hypothetical protein